MNFNIYKEKSFKKEEFIDLMKKNRLILESDLNGKLTFKDKKGLASYIFEYIYEEENIIKIINFIDIYKIAPFCGTL